MANEKQTPKKGEQKSNFFEKVVGFCKGTFFKVVRSFKDMIAELKKVTWPSRDELKNYSLVVLVFMAFMGIAVSLIDAGSALLVNWIIGL